MGWRDDLVEGLSGTVRVDLRRGNKFFFVSMSWEVRDIDMPEVCNHLARNFSLPSVTVERRTSPNTMKDGRPNRHSAQLRFTCQTAEGAESLKAQFSTSPRKLAQIIVSIGT